MYKWYTMICVTAPLHYQVSYKQQLDKPCREALDSLSSPGSRHFWLPLTQRGPQFTGYVILMVYIFTSHADFRTEPLLRDSVSRGFPLSVEVKCEIEKTSPGLLRERFPSGLRFSVEAVFSRNIVQVNSERREEG